MERLGVAAALSPALVAFVALVANFTPYGITRTPILVGTCGLTVAFALVGAERRFRLAPSKRFAPSLPLAGVSFTNGSRPRDSSSTTVYNLALGVSLLCVLGSAGFALAVGPDSAEFTGLSVEVNDQSVERAAALEPGESVTIVVENHEGEARDYTAVVVAQRVAERDDGTVHVTGQRGLTTRQVSVAAGERGTATFEAAPLSGEMDEVAVLLYENDAPTNPTRESAYRVLTLEIA